MARKPPWDSSRARYKRPGRELWTPDDWRKLERMKLAGWSSKRIAKALGRTDNAVDIAWCRYGSSPEFKRVQAYLSLVRTTIDKSLDLVNKDPQALKVLSPSKSRRTFKELEAIHK